MTREGGRWAQERQEPILGRLRWASWALYDGKESLREAQGLRLRPCSRVAAGLTPGDLGRAKPVCDSDFGIYYRSCRPIIGLAGIPESPLLNLFCLLGSHLGNFKQE